MKTAWHFSLIVLLLAPLAVTSQPLAKTVSSAGSDGMPVLSASSMEKVGSGRLLQFVSQKLSAARSARSASAPPSTLVALYSHEAPSASYLARLAAQGVKAFPESWTPPTGSHPLGYFLAQMPCEKFAQVLNIDDVKKMETAEMETVPLNNQAAVRTHADIARSNGWTGKGVKVAVLDAGLDISYAGTDLPAQFTARDYSNYPFAIDTVVTNTSTGHGTHVAGTLLGRGSLSAANTANGGGSYRGLADSADLVFLKIGNDYNGGASDAAQIFAIHAAVDSFNVKLLNLSYGGWDTYHDGTNAVSQAIDWAYSRGVACFVAAGNSASLQRHAYGSAPAHDTSAFIQVNVTDPGPWTQLKFNLVWFDGFSRNGLTLLYYDANEQLIAEVTHYGTTQSARGTESQYSYTDQYVPNQSGTYYLRVVNPSAVAQDFHIYENTNDIHVHVRFAFADPRYTVCYPADADHAFAVGAYSARDTWTGVNGILNQSGTPLQSIVSFSSKGPRVDGLTKPNITAPGSMIISLLDHNLVEPPQPTYIIDNDGISGGASDYFIMEGTSMASPVCAGAAALLYQHSPSSTPQQIYDALVQNAVADSYTGAIPNASWGYGKLDVNTAIQSMSLPVELTSFSSLLRGEAVVLAWHTATETNNYGFEIQKREVTPGDAGTSPAASDVWTKIGFVAGNGTSSSAHEYSFIDKPAHAGTYAYRLKQIDRDGKFEMSKAIEVSASAAPAEYSLSQNYPNPFNPSTTIRFTVGSNAKVHLAVYDLLGREVAVLADRVMQPGTYSVEWNAASVPSGVYFYRLEAGSYSAVKKLLLQK